MPRKPPLSYAVAVGPDQHVHYAMTGDEQQRWLCRRGSGGPGPGPSMLRFPLCEACCAVPNSVLEAADYFGSRDGSDV